MIKCIFTNIKNEHQYLDAWIRYHIKLGFNKFILFEDDGSISHSEIISKYDDIVDIDLYNYILSNKNQEYKDLTCFKYIWENYTKIDWLIKLDPDEYLTIPKEYSSIDDYLYSLKPSIKQIYINYKIFNANGHIQSPSAEKYNLIDTYTFEVQEKALNINFEINKNDNINYFTGKSILRYSSIKKNIDTKLKDSMIPDDFPNRLINTKNIVYSKNDNVFINHYITKSFSEFLYKLKDRGYYQGHDIRKIGDFFILNPDLIDYVVKIEDDYFINILDFKTKVNN